ncbi:MAG: bifunctional riboflavin kinase/FAD synthetase [Epsilonproteobacteria bacterium]|nr:bifunctional riboflavin kinase/FAD synthetase [Campylobacterota bacterium]
MRRVTIGGFDGVHLAHQYLIEKSDFVVIIEKGSCLTPGFDRLNYIQKPFDFLFLNEIKNNSPMDFINYLKRINTSTVIVGEDFRFGYERKGDIILLKNFFNVEIVKEIIYKNIKVHSRIIRKLLLEGNIGLANELLNKKYKIRGIQIKGQGLGKKELVPTINIELVKSYLIPKPGVYLTYTNGYKSLTFVGKRSTDENFSIETHILEDFKIQRLIEIEFIKFLRFNIKFASLTDLKKQILQDIKLAKLLFTQHDF